MKVLKFGGTSVGSPERMKKLAKLIPQDQRQIVVLSAVAGTTNHLVNIANALFQKEHEQANTLIDMLEANYIDFIKELYTDKQALKKAGILVTEHFNAIRAFTQDLFTSYEERIVLAQGELLSTALFHYYLEEQGIPSVLLPALDFMKIDEDAEPLIPYISEHLKPLLNAYPENKIFITQGYICRNAFGEIDNLKRGGGDYSASLIGAGIGASEIQIWTDIDGMHNNDPRIVKNTTPLSRLSFDEAAELAYFGAKILHPQSILPAQKYNIPVRLLNTMQPEAKGTYITGETEKGRIKAVAAKDGIVAVKIQSSRMLLAYGFLRKVFEIFERYKTPIDVITTSEVAVSVSIDNITQLEHIVKELKDFGSVEIDYDLSIICVVGDISASSSGHASRVFEALRNIPLRMISYGGSDNNISMLIKTVYKTEAMNALHNGLFN